MSEFYELLTPDMYSQFQKCNLGTIECMICYEECNVTHPVAIFPCFHMMHVPCANKTIEMSFKNAIHPNTILDTWEFHCPQRDSSESLGERERQMKQAIGRPIRPPIPRCSYIPIPHLPVDQINYFSLPYVINWYSSYSIELDIIIEEPESTLSILVRLGLVGMILYYLPRELWVGLIFYAVFRYFYTHEEIMRDENRVYRLVLTGILLYCYINDSFSSFSTLFSSPSSDSRPFIPSGDYHQLP